GGPVTRADLARIEFDFLLQRPAHGLHDAAFDLVFEAVRIDDLAGIDRGVEAWHRDASAGAVDLDIGDHRNICGEILVFGKANAAPLAAIAEPIRSPTRLLRHRLDHGAGAGVLEMRQTE